MAKRQYIVHRRKVKTGQSEMELSALVRNKLALTIRPDVMRKFVCDHFHILSILCHKIHENESNPPGT